MVLASVYMLLLSRFNLVEPSLLINGWKVSVENVVALDFSFVAAIAW